MVTCLIYLSSFMTWERSIVYLGWTLERRLVSLHVHEQAGFGSTLINTMNNCLGAIAMLYAIFEQFRELNLNKITTIKVAYAKRAISKRWNGSQVHCTTHSSLWV